MFSASIVPVSEHYKVSLVLYRKDIELIEELLEIVDEAKQESDMVIMADGTSNEGKFLTAISEAKKKFKIKSTSVAFSKILEMAKETKATEEGQKGNG